METGRKASRVYEGMREDEKEQKVPVPSKGKVDNRTSWLQSRSRRGG